MIHWIYHTEATVPVRDRIISNDDPKDTSFVTKHILSKLYSHKQFYTQAILIEGQNSLEDYILSEAKENWELLIDARLNASKVTKDSMDENHRAMLSAALDYYCYGHFIITVSWIKRGMDIEPDKLAELMDTVALQGFEKVMDLFTDR